MNEEMKNMIWSYLDSQDFHTIDYNGNIIFFESYESYNSRIQSVLISIHRQSNECYVKPKLLKEIESYFNIGWDESLPYVGSWVVNKVGFNIKKFYFD